MTMAHPNNQHVFAIIRFDTFQAADSAPEDVITIKKIVWDQATAEYEAARLNSINADKNCIYFWQITRLAQRRTENRRTKNQS